MTIKKVAEKSILKKEALVYDKNHDLRCCIRIIFKIFNKMTTEKIALMEKLEFGVLRHITSLNVNHKQLNEQAHSFDLYKSSLNIRYGKIKITPAKIGDALDLNIINKILFSCILYQSNFSVIFTLFCSY
ncbi:hypothetical protein AHAS_Ahas20G0220900 [Arachis hypogaea]